MLKMAGFDALIPEVRADGVYSLFEAPAEVEGVRMWTLMEPSTAVLNSFDACVCPANCATIHSNAEAIQLKYIYQRRSTGRFIFALLQ